MSSDKVTMGVQLFGEEIECPRCHEMTKGFGPKTMLIFCDHCKFIIDPARPKNNIPNEYTYASYLEWCSANGIPSRFRLNEEEFSAQLLPKIAIEQNKLQDGDYTEGLTDVQVYDLLKIEGLALSRSSAVMFGGTVIFEHGMLCPDTGATEKKRKLDFAEMREKAINTFRKCQE